jgi:hypothetical protein
MNYIKKFEDFSFAEAPTKEPIVKPATPGTRPSRPTPIRRDKPAVTPAPKAKMKKATINDVLDRFQEINNED